jgi:hypothetical protein
MSYWACAQLETNRERLALHCLGLAGFETYLPRIRDQRISRGRKIIVTPPLFVGYYLDRTAMACCEMVVGVAGCCAGAVKRSLNNILYLMSEITRKKSWGSALAIRHYRPNRRSMRIGFVILRKCNTSTCPYAVWMIFAPVSMDAKYS